MVDETLEARPFGTLDTFGQGQDGFMQLEVQ